MLGVPEPQQEEQRVTLARGEALDPEAMRREALRLQGLPAREPEAVAAASASAAADAMELLPDGWTVRRRDHMVVAEWRGFDFVAFDEKGAPQVSASALVERADPQAMAGCWSSSRCRPPAFVRAQAVLLLLVAIEAERRASAPADH